jgi:SDR family mycofactocin-dependent oxidoreductase
MRDEETMGKLDGQVALITGGGRGQGRSHAVMLAEAGADIAICDIDGTLDTIQYDMAAGRDLQVTADLVRATGRKCFTATADIRRSAEVDDFVAATIAQFGRIDVLCANAGVWAPALLVETSDELWRDTLDTNLTGTFNTVRATAKHMVAAGRGRIVVTSSMCGRQGGMNLSAYTATKWGVIGLVKCAAMELGEHGITVNAVCPSFVDTPMINYDGYNRMFRPDLENPTRETSDEVVRDQHHFLPTGSFGAAEVSKTVLFLAADADMISGTAIDVTAGKSAMWQA